MYIESYIYLGIRHFQITYEWKKKKGKQKRRNKKEYWKKIQMNSNENIQLTPGLEH